MDYILETLQSDWEALLHFTPRLVYGLIVLTIFAIVALFSGRLVSRVFRRSDKFKVNERYARSVVTWSIGLVGLLLSLGIMGFKGIAASVLATGGVAAIVLGFAFREVGENFIAGFFLTFSRPFDIGDVIKSGELTGTVVSIELRSVHVRTFDACDVFVPSAQIFRTPLHNYTRDGLRRPSFTVGVAYSDEPEGVLALLEEATRNVSDVLSDPAAFVSVDAFGAQYIDYKVHFWLDVETSKRGYVGTLNDVKIACWRALRDANMTFSTDVTSALEIKAVPQLNVELESAPGNLAG